jgi:C4-dicarboxylate-specific signal transduction histidine kinase
VLQEIRQTPDMDDIQVIMLTSEPKYFIESFRLGSDDFVNKPYEPVELQSRLKAAMKTRRHIKLVNEINHELAKKNEEITNLYRLLKETQFTIIQNEKMASIGQLAAGVAHEINNPLGFVASNLKSLEQFIQKLLAVLSIYQDGCVFLSQLSGEELVHSLKAVSQNAAETEERYHLATVVSELQPLFSDTRDGIARVSQIVRTLTSFAHVDKEAKHSECQINEIVEDALIVLKNEYKYTIDIETALDENDGLVCNKGEIEQVLVNVLINAIQAIKSQNRADRGNIEIRTARKPEGFEITISDDGPGIPSDKRNRIFEPFFTTKEVGEGTGLGLSISYDIIVNKHRGKIAASDNPSGGAVFTIVLPVQKSIRQ